MIEKLKKLGLTGYEAQAFITLLGLGNADASEIASQAKIPTGRIYNVLSNLDRYHLIRAQDTRPRSYECVEPAAAIERLLKNKQEELERANTELKNMADELASDLSRMRPQKMAKIFWTVAIGASSEELAQECIGGARKEVLFFMASRTSSERIKNKLRIEKYPGIINAIQEVLRKKVKVKAILNKDVDFSMLEKSPGIKRLLKHLGSEFECRFAAIPATPFHIIDRENVILQMLNPINPDELLAVINIRDMKLADELREKFFTIWEKAEVYRKTV